MPLCEVCGEELPELIPGHLAPGACWWNAQQELEKLRRTGTGGSVYVEGWAVRERGGQLEAFEHGWVELDGQPHGVTPHNHAVAYFPGFRVKDPGRTKAERGIQGPLYRDVTRPLKDDGQANPLYDARFAEDYAVARRAAEEYCRQHQDQGQQ